MNISDRRSFERNPEAAFFMFLNFWTGGPEVDRREDGINKRCATPD